MNCPLIAVNPKIIPEFELVLKIYAGILKDAGIPCKRGRFKGMPALFVSANCVRRAATIAERFKQDMIREAPEE